MTREVVVATPRFFERRWKLRVGLHFFRWGVHLKVRRGPTWFHAVAKFRRGPVWGRARARREFWIGWWTSEKGQHNRPTLVRVKVAIDCARRVRVHGEMDIPFYPLEPRKRLTERRDIPGPSGGEMPAATPSAIRKDAGDLRSVSRLVRVRPRQ